MNLSNAQSPRAIRPADVFQPLPLAIHYPLKCYRCLLSPFPPLSYQSRSTQTCYLSSHPTRCPRPPAFFLSLYFILDITTHHAVLFLCCLKILLPSLCVSVASVSRIQLYSFDQREFPSSSRFSERLWCLRHPSITSSFPRSSQQPRVELRPQSAMFDDCSCRSSISRTL